MSKEKRYLGDSVYVEFDGYYLRLTTENGPVPSNIIMLEPAVMEALSQYCREISEGASGPFAA